MNSKGLLTFPGRSRFSLAGIAAATFSLLCPGAVPAQTFDWNTTTDQFPAAEDWQNVGNWFDPFSFGPATSTPNGVGHIARLNLNLIGPKLIELNGIVTLGELRIGAANGLQSYFLQAGGGGELLFNNAEDPALLLKSGLAPVVIGAPIGLNGHLTVNVEDGNLLLGGVISGNGPLEKTGIGTLWLRNNAANSYTGTTFINEGMVISAPLANTSVALGALGESNDTIIAGGATLAIGQANFGQSGVNTGETITVEGRGFRNLGAIRAFINGAQTATISGPLTMTGLTRFHASSGGELTISSAFEVNHTVEITGQRLVNFTGAVSGDGTINTFGMGGLRMLNTSANQTFSGTINSFNGEVRSDPDVASPVNAAYGSIAALNLRNSWLRLGVRAGGNVTADNALFSTTAPISMAASRIYIDNRSYTTGGSQITYDFSQEFGIVTPLAGHNQIGMRAALTTGSKTMNFADIVLPAPGTTLQFISDNAESGHFLGQSAKNRVLNQTIEAGGGNVPFLGGNVFSNAEWVKYVTGNNGGNGYTPFVAADYHLNQAVGTWTDADHIKIDNTNYSITADTEIHSLNIAGGTARTLGGAAGSTLTIGSGGILTSGTTHVINVPFLTAGAESNFHLYNIAWATNRIDSVITDNGLNPVTLVKNGGGTTSFFGANTYTGSTIIHEGHFREVIGSTRVALGSGNLHFAGSSNTQATYETDKDFARPLGSGPGEVQFTGGGSVGGGSTGFSGFGRHIQVNFGGNADPVVWGSDFFNPGVFTLNGGNSTHPVTVLNPFDLGGEQRYIRLDGGTSGAGRGAIGRIEGDIFNGGVVKRGGGTLLIDTPNTYESGTAVEQGLLWLRAGGTLGANVVGNDIEVRSDGALHIDSPDLVGDRQMIFVQNRDNTTPVAIGFGPGYGDGSGIVFNSFNANGGIPQGGGNNIFITDSANGARRVAVHMNGMGPTSVDFPGLIRAVTAANTEVWFGATSANGVFTGDTLTPTGAVSAWRLGAGLGTLTIQNANVLDGAATLIVGSNDNNARSNMGGVVYIPQQQNFSGTITHAGIAGGTMIGSGGILVAGSNGALNNANNTILLRAGELRLSVAPGTYGRVDTQYAERNLDLASANGILRIESLGGSGQALVELNNLRLDGADRILTINSSTTRQNGVLFLGTTTLNHSANTNQFLDVGFDNQGFNSGFAFLQGQVLKGGAGNITLVKRLGGTLVLMADNEQAGTQIQQGNLVLTHTGAAGVPGATITMNTNNDRNSRLYFMMDGGGQHVFDNSITFQGGNNNSVRWVGVGPRTAELANLNAEVVINGINMNVATSVTNGNIIFDGAHGHRLTVSGDTVMARDTRFRVRGTVLTLDGTVSGAFALNKAEFGTLVLNGDNSYTGVTNVEQGTLVAGHANAFGNATSDVVFSSASSSQILVSGATTISRAFVNNATGNVQVLGGLGTGIKTLTGDVSLASRGLHLTAQGGDVNFTGIISGGGTTGITKIGPGTVILNPATGEGNTYSSGTTVASGILAGIAQSTSGSPFGTGDVTITNGALALLGIVGATNTSAGGLSVSGSGALGIWDQVPDTLATTMTFGSLTRTNNGTLTLVPYTGSLANEERLVFTSAPTLTNGIIGPWMVATNSFVDLSANYVTYSGGQVTTATYSGTGDLDGIATGNVWNATGGTLTANRTGFAFRTNADVNLGGNVLTLGAAGQAGIILNDDANIIGGAGSRIDLGVNQLSLYTAGDSVLAVPVTSFRPNTNNTLTDVGFIKFGTGELVVGADGLTGLQNSMIVGEGTLTAGAANIFPMFENLNGRTGGFLTILPNGTVNLAGFAQEIGNLQGIAPSNNINTRFFDTGGTLNLGGATLTVGRQGTSTVFGGQLIGGPGSTLIKVGGGDLNLSNINPDRANSLDVLQIDLGSVTTRADDNSMGQAGAVAFSLPSTTEVILRGGRWNLRSFGDGTGNQQTILVGNNVTAFGGNSVLSVDRPEAGGANKLLVLGNLSIDLNNFLVTAANTYIPRFDGTTTLTNHARIQTDTQLVLQGEIHDGGMGYTLNKIGGSDLGINADNSATWSGGFVARQGLTYFGTRGRDEIQGPGTGSISGNPNANLGTGPIMISQGLTSTTALRIYAPSNILTHLGQTVQIFGSDRSGRVRVDIGTDAPLTSYGLRSTTNGSLALGIGDGGLWTSTLDQAMMGNGRWAVGAFQTTYYMPDTLGAGIDNVYRFGGTTGALGLITPNVLNGSASMEIGRSQLHVGNTPTSSPAFLRTYGDQSFTGGTVIHRGADFGQIGGIWEFHGDIATPSIENFGRLEARGDGRFVDDAGNMVNQVTLRPGSVLRFNYNMDVNDQFVVSRQDNSNLGLNERKWGDDEPIFLDGAQLQITSASGRVSQETVGQITAAGGAGILLERVGAGQPILITNQGLVRQGQATLTIRNTTAAELGSIALQSQKFYINDAAWVAANRNNGMLNPWIFSLSNLSFVDYDPDTETGMTNAAWTQSGTGAAFLAGLTATDRAHYTAGNATLTGAVNVYAMRIAGGTTLGGQQINIHSGGLITNEAVTINSNLYFGDGVTATEGILAVANSTLTLGGIVTADNLTKAGPGGLTLTNPANVITGNFQMHGSTVILNGPGTLGSAGVTLHADYLNNNNGGQMPLISFRTASTSGTFNNTVTVAENVPLARIEFNRFSGTANGTITLSGITVEGTDGAAGTLLQIEHQNSYNSAISGPVNLGAVNPASDIGIRVNTGTSTWNGVVTASMPNLIKSGDGTLTLNNLDNALNTGLILNRGTVVSRANATGQTFQGDLEFNFGQLIVGNTAGTAGTVFAQANQSITINGQTTIRNQRFGSTNAHMTIGADNNGNVITTSNSPWVIFQANSFGDQFNIRSNLVINDAPWIRNDSTFLRTVGSSVTSGEGKINKVGTWYFSFENSGPNTYTGGTDIWAGEVMVRTTGATMGTGAVRLYPGAALAVRNVANLGATGLTQVVTSASAFPVLSVRNNDGGNAQFDAVLAAYANATFLGNGNGIIGLGGGRNYTADLNMATRNDGMFANWWLAATEGSGTVSADTLSPWGLGGSEFRLGGAHTGTLTMNPATAGADQLSGTGNRLIVGGGLVHLGYGTVAIGANADNTFDGGTLVQLTREVAGNNFRGAVLSVQGGANADEWRTPLGTGQVDVHGEIRIEGAAGTAANSATTNANTWVFHPGSRIRFDNGTAFAGTGGGGRWGDDAPITLNTAVLEMFGAGSNNAFNSETVGDLTIMGGSEVVLRRRGANWAEIVAGDLTRSGSATLMITGMVDSTNNAAGLGVAGTASAMRFYVDNGASLMNNGMVDPWIIDRVNSQFMKYDNTLGFMPITTGGAPANYVTTAAATLTAASIGVNDGSRIVNFESGANFTLGANLDVYAMRLNRDINVSADGQFQNIIIRSGGLTQFANTPTINANLFFGSSGNGDGEALIHASNSTLQINGKIHASQVTKFGIATLNIRSDQSQFTGDWVVNGGILQFLTPGAPSNGEIHLNGSRINDRDSTYNITEVRFNFNPQSPDLFQWQHGKIISTGYNRIYGVAANDRLIGIGDIDLMPTGTAQEGLVTLRMDSLRSTMQTGTVRVFGNYQLQIENNLNTGGTTTGVHIGLLDNQGLHDVRKAGWGLLTLGDNSSSFTNGTFSVAHGGVRVLHNGAFGDATASAIVDPTGALEIAVANWSPLASLTQAWGSSERWSVDQARGAGDWTMAPGVNLQIMASQTGTRTITMDGGTLVGYVPIDWDQDAIIHTLGAGITVNLASDSLLGQLQPAGVANGNNHAYYDNGKLNTTTNLNPNDPGLRGSYLQILGEITGAGGLTKVGQDLILLAGANTYQGATQLDNGILQIGRDNALPMGTDLMTRFTGMLDLNGFDQEVASLQGTGGSVNNGSFALNSLTVNQDSDTVYGGQLAGNVTLVKTGSGELLLDPTLGVNAYRGGTILAGGTLAVFDDSALGWAGHGFNAAHLTFDGGMLRTLSSVTLHPNRGVTLGAAGGGFAPDIDTTITIDTEIHGAGPLVIGGQGSVVLTNPGATARPIHINGGKLVLTDASGLGASPEVAGTADLTLNGGTLEFTEATGLNDDNRQIHLQALGGGFSVPNPMANLVIGSEITGPGGLLKTGPGNLILGNPNSYEGATTIREGTITIASASVLGTAPAVLSPAHLTLDGGTLLVTGDAALGATRGVLVDDEGGTFQVPGGVTLTIEAPLSGTGDIAKTGSGRMEILGDAPHTGAILVSDGALFLGGGTFSSSTVTVQFGTTLEGTATLEGDLLLGNGFSFQEGSQARLQIGSDTFAPGVSLFAVEQNVTLGDFAIIDFYLSQTGFGRLDVGGAITFSNTTRFRINLAPGYTPSVGSAFDLVGWGLTDLAGFDPLDWVNYFIFDAGDTTPWVTTDFSSGTLRVAGMATSPVLTDPPGGLVLAGGTISLSVNVSGSDPMSFIWQKDDSDLPASAHLLELVLENVTAADSGSYRLRAENAFDTVFSQPAVVDVVTSPRFRASLTDATFTGLADATVPRGLPITLSVSAIGPGTIEYQWFRKNPGDPDFSPIPGATESTLNLGALALAEDGTEIRAVASNDFPPGTATDMVLTVVEAIEIVTQPQDAAAAEGRQVVFNVEATGQVDPDTGDFSYQWQVLDGLVWTDLPGEVSDTLTLTVPRLPAGAEARYRVLLGNDFLEGAARLISDEAVLTIADGTLTLPPLASQIVPLGSDLVFEANAGGALPMDFVWRLNNGILAGSTGSQLVVAEVTRDFAGQFTVTASNSPLAGPGTLTSDPVTVAIVDTAPRQVVIRAGAATTLTAVAFAHRADPLAYQWYQNDGTPDTPVWTAVPGANARTLRLTGLPGGQNQFKCEVTAAGGMLDTGVYDVFVPNAPPLLNLVGPGAAPITALPATIVGEPYHFQIPQQGQTGDGSGGVVGNADPLAVAATFTARGLPAGLRIDNFGVISGQTTGPARNYPVTITARNAAGPPVSSVLNLEVLPLNLQLVGTFAGPIMRHPTLNANLGGMITMTTNPRGGYSGSLMLGTARVAFRGTLITDVNDQGNPTARVVISRARRAVPLVLTFRLGLDGLIRDGLISDGVDEVEFDGWRNVWGAPPPGIQLAGYAGRFNLGLHLPDDLVDANSTTIPQGTSFATFVVNDRNGRLTVSGRVSDGTAFTTATFVGPTGEVFIFRTLYPARARGSVVGQFKIDKDDIVDPAAVPMPLLGSLTGGADWMRPEDARSNLYPAGFHIPDLQIEGGRYVAPPAGLPVLGIDAALGNNALVQFEGANLETDLPVLSGTLAPNSETLYVSPVNVATVVSANLRALTLRITAATGAFNGRIRMSDVNPIPGGRPNPVVRNVNYQGLIVWTKVGPLWVPQGLGFLVVPQMPGVTPAILGGQVTFDKAP